MSHEHHPSVMACELWLLSVDFSIFSFRPPPSPPNSFNVCVSILTRFPSSIIVFIDCNIF